MGPSEGDAARVQNLRPLGAETRPGLRFSGATVQTREDWVAREEPLEIRITGEPFATTLRTPGNDNELVVGLLLAEGLVTSVRELGSVVHCSPTGQPRNVIDVTPAPGSVLPWPPEEGSNRARSVLTNSACGLCGRQTVDDLVATLASVPPLSADAPRVKPAFVRAMVTLLAQHQRLFDLCGGVHAAAFWPLAGDPLEAPRIVREDVGRHNAVDKVIGRAALDGLLPAGQAALAVSSRCSFEIVHKALIARIPLIVSISAPSSLAIEAAERGGATLIGFARAERFTVYSGSSRILSD
jgi:FdhD protein